MSFEPRGNVNKNYHHILGLGEVFVKYRVHEQFGLSLLHKHFDLFEDEYLVRRLASEHGAAQALELLSSRVRAYCEDGKHDAAGFERSGAFQQEIGDKLETLNLLDVFGVATTHILTLPCKMTSYS